MTNQLIALKKLSLASLILCIVFGCEIKNSNSEFIYHSDSLVLNDTKVKDRLAEISIDNLNQRKPNLQLKIQQATPFTQQLWQTALADIESNIQQTDQGRYFGAGKKFGTIIYTRDISYSGILGLNKLYPSELLKSLEVTRKVRLDLGWKVAKGYIMDDIEAPWEELDINEAKFIQTFHTNCFTRRTDDVVWLWAASDAYLKNPELADWEWLYNIGVQCFDQLYRPLYDSADGLYWGQASFIDIHYDNSNASGYPQSWSKTQCTKIKATSTNSLYLKGLEVMALAASKTSRSTEANVWQQRAEKLRQSMLDQLRFEDGTFTYFKHPNDSLEPRREALGSALAVLTDVVTGHDAKSALQNYPITWAGVPLLEPFYPENNTYHNNTAWPFVDTFFLWAREKAFGENHQNLNAALLARTCIDDGSFHELVDWKTKSPFGSGSQLWSASAFVNVCDRANLIPKW